MWSQDYLTRLPKSLYMFYLQPFESIAGLGIELKHTICFYRITAHANPKITAQEKAFGYIEVKN